MFNTSHMPLSYPWLLWGGACSSQCECISFKPAYQMALGHILISVLHIFSFSSMVLSSPLLFSQPLPQTPKTHSESFENLHKTSSVLFKGNWLQAQKENMMMIHTAVTKLSWMCWALSQFHAFSRLWSTEIKLEAETPRGLRALLPREGRESAAHLCAALPDAAVLPLHLRRWTSRRYETNHIKSQMDSSVPCLHQQSGAKASLLSQGDLLPVLR